MRAIELDTPTSLAAGALTPERSDRFAEFVRRRKVSRLERFERLPHFFGSGLLFRALDQFVLRDWERQFTEAFHHARRRRTRGLLGAGSSVWLYRHADPCTREGGESHLVRRTPIV